MAQSYLFFIGTVLVFKFAFFPNFTFCENRVPLRGTLVSDDVIVYPPDDDDNSDQQYDGSYLRRHAQGYDRSPGSFQHDPDYHREHNIPVYGSSGGHHHHGGATTSRTPFVSENKKTSGSDFDYDEEFKEILKSYGNNTPVIPIDFIQHLNSMNVSDLLLNYADDEDDVAGPSHVIKNRFGETEEDTERDAGTILTPAKCMPELKTVQVISNNDPAIFYLPDMCTRVERCGGCCNHVMLECQPVEKEYITQKVHKFRYVGNGQQPKPLGKELVVVEKHTKCACGCKIKPEDCNKYQEHINCRCICKNRDEEKKCYKNSKKLWNPKTCSCQCRDVSQCSTGFEFSHNECRCVTNPVKRRFARYGMKGYKTDAQSVLGLNE